jgi:hypothetical protein
MRNLYLVSFPRSGQHYTQRMIEEVTGVDEYCELYNCWVEGCPGQSVPVNERSPCLSGRRIQKTHDFDLNFPVNPAAQYAVLLRTPMFSLVSWYEYEVNVMGMQDSHMIWEAFAREKSAYWDSFVNKWCDMAEANENVRIFRYEDMTTDPATISEFFAANFPGSESAKIEHFAQKQVRQLSQGHVGGRSLAMFKYPLREAVNTARANISKDTLARLGYTDVLPAEFADALQAEDADVPPGEDRRWWQFWKV